MLVTADDKLKEYMEQIDRHLHKHGTFVGLRVSPISAKMVLDFCADHNIPDPVPIDEQHVTIAHSKNNPMADYPVDKNYTYVDKNIKARAWDVFGEQKDTLVLKLGGTGLFKLHKQATASGLTHTFDPYVPHLSFTYNLPADFDINNLPLFDLPILFTGEYKEGCKL